MFVAEHSVSMRQGRRNAKFWSCILLPVLCYCSCLTGLLEDNRDTVESWVRIFMFIRFVEADVAILIGVNISKKLSQGLLVDVFALFFHFSTRNSRISRPPDASVSIFSKSSSRAWRTLVTRFDADWSSCTLSVLQRLREQCTQQETHSNESGCHQYLVGF